MPSKVDNLTVGEKYDRRRKLTNEQYEEIRHKYATGKYSYNSLAKEYNVSKKLICIIINPESKRKSDERMKEHWADYRANKDQQKENMRKYRAYKRKLLDEGKIGNK